MLNKDFILEPLLEMQKLFPDWLKENKEKLPKEEFEKWNQQFKALNDIIEAYEKEKPFEQIAELMQEVKTIINYF